MLGGEVKEKAVKISKKNVRLNTLKVSKSEKVLSPALELIDESARQELI